MTSPTTLTTLTTAPVAPLLARLFDEADASSATLQALAAGLAPGELQRLMRSKTDYPMLYGELRQMPLPVSRSTGRLLYLLARSTRARAVVEFGTSFGISTLHLAAALRDNGGGRLIGTEFEPTKVPRAQANLVAGGLADLVEIRGGDALHSLRSGLPEAIDLVLLDGAKALYLDVLALLQPRLRPGALVVADNADHCPEYLARVRDPAHGWLSLPCGDEVELSMRLA